MASYTVIMNDGTEYILHCGTNITIEDYFNQGDTEMRIRGRWFFTTTTGLGTYNRTHELAPVDQIKRIIKRLDYPD